MVRILGFGLLISCALALPAWSQTQRILKKLDDQSHAGLSHKRGPHLDVRVARAEDLVQTLRIYTGTYGDANFSLNRLEIVKISPKRALIPYYRLSPGFKKAYLQALWPNDTLKGGYWRHQVVYSGHETLWTLAQVFTGAGKNYRAIQKASGLKSENIKKGHRLKIPASILLDILSTAPVAEFPKPSEPIYAIQAELKEGETVVEERDQTPSVSAPGDPSTSRLEPEQKKEPAKPVDNAPSENQGKSADDIANLIKRVGLESSRGELSHGVDGQGRRFASYRLKQGEAIYSSVVVRFCGLVRADDVNRVAADLIKRNNIRDETDLPIGFSIRIPYDYLEPEFKAEDDPEFIAYIKNLEDVSRVSTDVRASNLEGVYLILDAGHGGRDPGAYFKTVWEDDYVYDIVCRIKQKLETETAATVYTTVLDPNVQYKVQNVTRFSRDHDEVILTKPRFSLNSTRVTTDGVNLRWILANHHYHQLVKKGIKPENVIFASFHADSLHRSLRGSMIYIPDSRNYPRRVSASAKFKKYREYKSNHFSFTAKEQLQAQARSLNFAKNFIGESKKQRIPIHKQKPIRTAIFRNPSSPFVPAVLKYNRIPTRCLIEVCNLNNSQDREQLTSARYRQKVADAFVASVYQTYGLSKENGFTSLSRGDATQAQR